LEHKPALSLEVDWAGTKIAYFDTESGQMSEASLFVALLPCSQLIYAEPFRDEKLPSWIAGHVNAFQYFGGVPKTLVPDNLRAGVRRPNFYAPELNKTYQEMAAYYGTVILPARVRKPKDKPSVENSVLIASRQILARLRNVQICKRYSTSEPKKAKTLAKKWTTLPDQSPIIERAEINIGGSRSDQSGPISAYQTIVFDGRDVSKSNCQTIRNITQYSSTLL